MSNPILLPVENGLNYFSITKWNSAYFCGEVICSIIVGNNLVYLSVRYSENKKADIFDR